MDVKSKAQFYVICSIVCVVICVAVSIVFCRKSGPEEGRRAETKMQAGLSPSNEVAASGNQKDKTTHHAREDASGKKGGLNQGERQTDDSVADGDLTEEEKREKEAEKFVEAFYGLTDKWMEPAKEGVTMKDVDEFVAHFRKVPKARKDECLHRALNLVPDENVMLLAGILMDKSQDKELIELVYNDVLNRDESVKKPILQQIFKDKEHPCWADTAWILDVTGERPGKK